MDVLWIRAAQIAAAQHGRITTRQLAECGIGRSGIEKGVAAGRLHRLQIGVFALGHVAPSREAGWQTAVLACGPDAKLSDACAATAFGFHDRWGPRVDVTVPPNTPRRRPGVHVRRRILLPFEATEWRGIAITTPARTMVDLAHELRTEERITWALRQLEFGGLFDLKLLELSNDRRRNAILGRLLTGIEPTRSPLEIAFLHRVVRRHQLPVPEVNARVHGFLADFWWPEARLIVETDGRQHDDPLQQAADRARDAIHEAAGIVVRRYRWADVGAHERTAIELSALIRSRSDA
jgi:very-short-patch-repair endonuclease